ncbi:hypothetical protein QVD17_41701 [Tagetes erecta]|uniref:Uncharacterized protein n=1 Tax=Tagetes erecta TaxID=13708 RepID=A0AAD8JL44_TARER|nr:hypothetical protein QVD17_41701 [Tagetes erecta]
MAFCRVGPFLPRFETSLVSGLPSIINNNNACQYLLLLFTSSSSSSSSSSIHTIFPSTHHQTQSRLRLE